MSAVDEGHGSNGDIEGERGESTGTMQLLGRLGHGLVLMSTSSEETTTGGGAGSGTHHECQQAGDGNRNSAAGKEVRKLL